MYVCLCSLCGPTDGPPPHSRVTGRKGLAGDIRGREWVFCLHSSSSCQPASPPNPRASTTQSTTGMQVPEELVSVTRFRETHTCTTQRGHSCNNRTYRYPPSSCTLHHSPPLESHTAWGPSAKPAPSTLIQATTTYSGPATHSSSSRINRDTENRRRRQPRSTNHTNKERCFPLPLQPANKLPPSITPYDATNQPANPPPGQSA